MSIRKIITVMLIAAPAAVATAETALAAGLKAPPILSGSPPLVLISAGGIILMIFIATSVALTKKLKKDRNDRRNQKTGYSAFKHTSSQLHTGVRYCPYCASRQLTGSPFCAKCGKLMK
jgi:hypothetical protein